MPERRCQLFQARFDDFAIFLGAAQFGQRAFGFPAQNGDRCAQFMGKISGKLREPGERILEASEHLVVANCERLQFIRPPLDRNAFVQARRAGAVDGFPEISQRTQNAAGHEKHNSRASHNSASHHPGEQSGVAGGESLVVGSFLRELQRQPLLSDIGDGGHEREAIAIASVVNKCNWMLPPHRNRLGESVDRQDIAHLWTFRDNVARFVENSHRVRLVGCPYDAQLAIERIRSGIRGDVGPDGGELVGQITIVVVIDMLHDDPVCRAHGEEQHGRGRDGTQEGEAKNDRPRPRLIASVVAEERVNPL